MAVNFYEVNLIFSYINQNEFICLINVIIMDEM